MADPVVIAWPVSLPSCAQDWQEQDRPSVIRTDMDVGPPKVRRRYTAPMRQQSVTMILENAQVIALRSFYEVDLNEGVNYHSFTHPYSGAVETFRFVEPPNFQSQGALVVQVSMTWEQLPYST